jgi:malate dehydrogenase (oxaloacetate-decarboxylating)(NADP+)
MHLVVPENLSLVFLPPYSPELNPIERLWLHQVTPEQLNLGMLFPPQSNMLEVEIQTAARVAKLVFDSGLARVERPTHMASFTRRHVSKPEYPAEAAAATRAA